ncbi:MAG: hypothetical protein Q8P27_03230 [Candidatus Peregrinibacteria bacterium]|nr:hypothetical protein [Candidatus Peregrinibacteria bacterium]
MARRSDRPFESFRDEMNAGAPFAQMGRALSLVDPGQAASVEDRAVDEVLESMSASFSGLGEASSREMVDFRTLLRARLRPLLRVSDDPGLSMLDVVTHGATTDEEIARALQVYGIDLSNDSDLLYATSLLDEAVKFYDEYVVADSQDLGKVAAPFRSHDRDPRPQDIFKIFKAAAGHGVSRNLIPQACGLLRIAMVIDHYKTHPRVMASQRIFEAVNHHLNCIKPLPGGGYNCNLSGDPHDPGIHIHEFRVREKKSFLRLCEAFT